MTVHKPQADWLVLSNQTQPGLVRFALAGLQPIAQEVVIGTVMGTVQPGVTAPIFAVERLLVNEQAAAPPAPCAAVTCVYLALITR